MANIMKSVEECELHLDKTDLDTLFDIYLKPLRSKNARKIFKVLSEEKKVGSLTTLDIQTKLDDIGITLSKKEINGWLHSLLTAGLVSKEKERGKPTTIDYDDKYTFDLWKLTYLGTKIAEDLPYVLGTRPNLVEGDVRKLLKELAEMETDRRVRILRNIDELNMLIKMLLKLLETDGELNKSKLIKRLEPSRNELDRLLSKYSNQDRGLTLMLRKPQQHGLKVKLLSFLGLFPSIDDRYVLTEEGRHFAEAFRSVYIIGY